MSLLTGFCLLTAVVVSTPSSEEILANIANTTIRRHATSYSGFREYKLRNMRFAKEATVTVREIYRSGEGKQFRVLARTGSPKLAGIVEKLLTSEAEASRPEMRSEHAISPTNYEARLRGTEATAGRVCYVIGLKAKHKSKYLINGTLWVDANSYNTVRLEGSTAASVSMWIGTPQIVEEFNEVGEMWLPSRTRSVSSGTFLGTSELEIRYTGYQLLDIDTIATRTVTTHVSTCPR